MSEHIGSLASLIGSLTVVGSALIWVYNQFIAKPRERWRQEEEDKRQLRMLQVVTRENKPLNESIRQLTEWLNESKLDRENLNKIVREHSKDIEEHELRLDNAHDRLIVLETSNNFIKKFQYQGGD